jgi:hypothetical protein
MTGKNTAVFGIYPTADAAERAVDVLIRGGFASGDISVLLPDVRSNHEFAHQKETKAPEGTTAGVTAGGVIGGTLGVLAGVGALALPGLGPLIAAGPIVAGLAGLGVGGAVGGLVGALIGMGIPEYEAKRYEGRVRDGGTLLSVHCNTSKQIRTAKDLLKQTGAQDIASAGESAAADPADRRAATDPRYTSDPRVARDPRYTPSIQDPYAGDQSDPADPYQTRIYR